MTAPTLSVAFGFGSTWKTADGSISWTDVSGYVRDEQQVKVSRGRQSERDDFAAGTCSFTLNNADRRFDPQHAAGPYFGDLVPGVPVRVRCTANAVVSDVFRGFVHGWPQRYHLGNTLGVVPILASDGFRRLARADLPKSVWMLEASADPCFVWWRLSESTGQVATDTSGNSVDGVLGYVFVDNLDNAGLPAVASGDPLVAFDDATTMAIRPSRLGAAVVPQPVVVDSPSDLPTALPITVEAVVIADVSSNANAEYIFRAEIAGDVTPRLFFSAAVGETDFTLTGRWGDGATGYTVAAAPVNFTDRPHHVAAVFAAADIDLYIDGVLVSGAPSGSTTGGAKRQLVVGGGTGGSDIDLFSGRIGDFRLHDSALDAARIAAHADAALTPWMGDTADERITRILDHLGWPASLRALSAGDSTLGATGLGGKALPFLKAVEMSEQGKLFIGKNGKVTFLNRYWSLYNTKGTTVQVTLSDDGADTAYSDMGFDYDDELVFNSATGSRQGGATITVTDETSVDAYGFAADSELTGLQLASDYWVQSMLEYRVDRYKDPKQRLPTIKIPLHGLTAAKQSALLELELAYRVNVERTPQQVGTAIDVDETIEGIVHDIGAMEHWMTFNLSTVDTRLYGIWDTSLWDDADARWGF